LRITICSMKECPDRDRRVGFNLALWGAAICIAIFEIAVLYLAFRPRVSDSYASYYITHEASCYSPGDRPETEIGKRLVTNSRNADQLCWLFGKGWSRPEDWGTWTDGKVARLTMRLSEATDRDLLLTFDAYALSRIDHQAVTIYASGAQIGSIDVATGPDKEYRILVPRMAIDQGKLSLEFHIEAPVSPQDLGPSRDWRDLGVCLRWLRLDPVEGAQTK
jgi:hypothetical protein